MSQGSSIGAGAGWSGQLSGSRQSGPIVAIVIAAVTVAIMMLAFPFADGKRIILTGAILLVLAWHLFSLSNSGLAITFLFLAFLGGLRRFLIPYVGWAGFEPLLLVAPILTGLYFSSLVARRKIAYDTPIAKCIFWMVVIMLLQVFNPRQGGLMVGVAGIIYLLVPLLWYYIGRNVATQQSVQILLKVVVIIAVLSAADGLRQTFSGLNETEKYWLNVALGNSSVIYHFGPLIRGFGFSTSAEEYAFLLGIGVVLCWTRFVTGSRLALIPLPLFACAIFWESSRSVMVATVFTCAIIWSMLTRNSKIMLVRLVIALILGAVGLSWSMQAIKEQHLATEDIKSRALIQHNVDGVLNVGNSTAVAHSNEVVQGILSALINPFGRGLGATTIAGTKFASGSEAYSTEFDISDAFAGLGLVGGILYVVILCRVFYIGIRRWMVDRNPLYLCIVAIMIIIIGRWMNGANGTVSMLAWSLAGYLDSQDKRARQTEKAKESGAALNRPAGNSLPPVRAQTIR